MATLREWMHRLWGTIRRNPRDREMEEELRSHLELASDDMLRGGRSTEDALRASRLRAGGAAQAMEAMRDQRGLPWLDDLTRDVRHAVRSLRRTPVFTAVALLTLALGIGANTAIFSIVNGVILRPLGYPKPGQLMYVSIYAPQYPSARWLSPPEYEEFRKMNRSFAHVGAFVTGEANLTTADRPLRVRAAAVDEHLLATLGFQPAQGRFFAAEEIGADPSRTGVGARPIAILSHELWQSAFGGQPLVGKTVAIDGRSHEIIGIMPPGADVMDNRTEVWLPLGLQPNRAQDRNDHELFVMGRLKDGMTEQGARTELDAFLTNWGERAGTKLHVPTNHPSSAGDHTLQMQSVHDAIVGDAGRSIWLLQVAVGFVLLIACANLANLFLARAESRRREFALRSALGASRSRLFRQMITEGLLLSVAGGIAGLWLAGAGVHALTRAYPTSVPRMNEIAIDMPVLLFALGMSVATGVFFGLAPFAQKRANDLMTALKESGDRGASGAGRQHIRYALVMAEVALAVMLVIGAGLLIRTVYNLTTIDEGFDRSRLVTFSMTLPFATSEPDTREQAYQRVLEKLRAAPGVQAASAMSDLPLSREIQGQTTPIENYTSPAGKPYEVVDYYQVVMSDYFETMGIPIVAGRSFERTDIASKANVVVINETLANRIWKGRSPIGQRVRPNVYYLAGDDGKIPWHTVIGVAKDVKQDSVDRETRGELYVFAEEHTAAPATMNVVLRTMLPPSGLSQTIERLVKEVDPAVPVVRLRDMDSVFAESIRRPRLLTLLLGSFAGLALLLAAIGTYGVLSYMVTERRREIGIRIALGAGRSEVFALVMKDGLKLTVIGIAVGVAGAFGLNRWIASLLFGVQPTDGTTLAAVIATITVVAAIACWLPAWRASRVDPSIMLRHE